MKKESNMPSRLAIIFCSLAVIILSINVAMLHIRLNKAKEFWLVTQDAGDGWRSKTYYTPQTLIEKEVEDFELLKNKLELLSQATGYKYVDSDSVSCKEGYFKDGKRPNGDPCFGRQADHFIFEIN